MKKNLPEFDEFHYKLQTQEQGLFLIVSYD